MVIPEYFGSMVFGDAEMRARLSESTYNRLRRTVEFGRSLDLSIANEVASAMKDWAVSKGATHFTHWFQPMTGITAEKHECFLSPAGNGKIIMEFSGKELVQGESDASSFPSGGLRATFEARGYTAWDPTSYAFIKNNTLCIPTAFCSWGGEALDKKTPLLRSIEALNRQAMRILKLFGNDTIEYVRPNVGPEQEYFLIDKEMYEKRPDLVFTGRTLFGARPPKGQELDDHYFGALMPRVAAFMKDLDEELWKLGIMAKTEHNEAAPAQYELAPLYCTANIATDHNQLTMEIMQQVAKKHGLVCLLHEKPFEGVAGSGKHNNWSISGNDGTNLLKPGQTPQDNAQFLLFLVAVIQAADNYPELLRLSVASAGNDHRLGREEAPPAIVSVFLGDELGAILESIESDSKYVKGTDELLRLGVHTLPKLPKDTSDRNRTSPLAFTGNKFEFRMLGSAESTACTNIMMNTTVAESLRQYADELESVPPEKFNEALHRLIGRVYKEHKKVIFNGNGYGEEWIKEATLVRGLPNIPTTSDAVPHLTDPKNLELFATHRVYTATEARSRADIILDHYNKVINIEAITSVDIVRRMILPAIYKYEKVLSDTVEAKQRAINSACRPEKTTLAALDRLANAIYTETEELAATLASLKKEKNKTPTELSVLYRDRVCTAMESLRKSVDAAELITDTEYWPLPNYGEILFSL
ncbi:MAG: glutamine synthetase III [Clostridia bacterium]|nr:glutamine synthetase III [Clostridia bacterium]